MKSCILINGVTLPAFEDQINRILADDESAELAELMFVQGTGFVAAIIREAKEGSSPRHPEKLQRQAKRPAKPQGKR